MRPPALAWLLVSLFLTPAATADSPFAGNWRVQVLDPRVEPSPWLIQVSADGKQVRLLNGVGKYAKATLADGRGDGRKLTFAMVVGRTRFAFVVPLPKEAADRLPGAVHTAGTTLPAWLERTEQVELTEKSAVRPLTGGPALEAARQLPGGPGRVKALRALLRKHPGTATAHLASQALIAELIRQGADEEAVRPVLVRYLELVAGHGPDLLLATQVSLAQNLAASGPLAGLALESARAAVSASASRPPQTRLAAQLLLAAALHRAGKADELPAVVRAIEQLGDELLRPATTPLARLEGKGQLTLLLLGSPAPGVADLGLAQARQAAALVRDDMPIAARLAGLRLLAQALEDRGKKDEARALAPRLERLEADLDDEYRARGVPFEVEQFAGRKGKSERVVLVELFTGAQNPLCQASDLAFTAALRSYGPRDVVFLQYHAHVPLPDALTTPDGEARQKFYGRDREDIPAVLVDGKPTVALGGERQRGRVSSDNLREAIDRALEAPAAAQLRLYLTRRGAQIEAKAEVRGVRPGTAARLRFALVEQTVRYPGRNGVRLHAQVVRAMPGGAAGIPVEPADETHTVRLDLDELRRSHTAYLDAYALKHGIEWTNRPLELRGLRVIAWVQDTDGKQVLQAVQADVPAPSAP